LNMRLINGVTFFTMKEGEMSIENMVVFMTLI